MKQLARLLLAALAAIGIVQASVDTAHACSNRTYLGALAGSCGTSLLWRYDNETRSFVQGDRITDRAGADRYRYTLNERCYEGVNCGSAVYTCPPEGGREGRMYQSFAQLLLPNGDPAPVDPVARFVCVYPGRSVPLAVVEAAVHEEIRKRIVAPSVTSAPPGKSLVNLLTIYATPVQPEPRIDITQPVPGSVAAVPRYAWDFGDGLTGVGPGTAYQSGDLPSKLPGKYLGATYRAPGTKHVTVTVTWRVQFRLEGVLDVPLAPIVLTASEDKVIATADPVLVSR